MLRPPLNPDNLSETLVRVTRAVLLRDYKRNLSAYHTQPLVAIATLAQDVETYASNVIPTWLMGLHYDMQRNGLSANQSLQGMLDRAKRGCSWRQVCFSSYKANRYNNGRI